MTTTQHRDVKPTDKQTDNAIDETTVCMFNLKPAFVLMALGGCYSQQVTGSYILSTMMWIYKGLVAAVIFIYALRTITLLSVPVLVLSAFVSILLSVQSFGNMVFSWKMFSTRYGHFNKAYSKLHDVVSVMTSSGINVDTGYFTNRRHFIVSFALLTVLLGVLAQVVLHFVLLPVPAKFVEGFGNFSDLLSSSYSKTFEDTLVIRFVMFLGLVIHLFPYTLPTFFLMSISVALLTAFKALNKRIEDVISFDTGELCSDFETVRKIHADLCSTIQIFDKDLGLLFGNIFLWTIAEGILVLYMVVKYTMPITIQVTIIYYLSFAFVMLASVSILAAMVNEAAHAPLDIIYTINVKEEIGLGKVTQLTLFLSRLTGSQVGLTTFGLMTITKEFILTIAGAFLTYFTVLYTL